MRYVPREIEKQIELFLARREIVALVGARQTGKTTLLKHLFQRLKKQGKKVFYLTFEKESDLALFENVEDFKTYYQNYQVIIIDEFHYAQEGGKKLKYLFDTTPTKFIISGSSSLELTFSTGRYLVGRMVKFYLYPFSFGEYLWVRDPSLYQFHQKFGWDFQEEKLPPITFPFGQAIQKKFQKVAEEYFIFGGYPAIVLAKSVEEKSKLMEGIVENYLLREITLLLNLKTKNELLQLTKLLAVQIGNLVNFQELSSTSRLSYPRLIEHLRILENTFIISLLTPFYRNPRTELVKSPKVYFEDVGWRNWLLGKFILTAGFGNQGNLAENFVFSHLKRKENLEIHYWRTKAKAEVDFVIEKGGEVIPVEVKYSPAPTLGKSFLSFLSKYQPKLGFILTKNVWERRQIGKTEVRFLPLYLLK